MLIQREGHTQEVFPLLAFSFHFFFSLFFLLYSSHSPSAPRETFPYLHLSSLFSQSSFCLSLFSLVSFRSFSSKRNLHSACNTVYNFRTIYTSRVPPPVRRIYFVLAALYYYVSSSAIQFRRLLLDRRTKRIAVATQHRVRKIVFPFISSFGVVTRDW